VYLFRITLVTEDLTDDSAQARKVFIELWSADQRLWAEVLQVVRGGPQAVSEEKALQKLYQKLSEWKIHTYMHVLELPLLADLQYKVGELVISITSSPTVIILENTLI
jgi:hypothetical protein